MMSLRTPGERRVMYWEDMIQTTPRRYGPVVCSSELLDQLLDLLGERHPVHDSDEFAHATSRRRRIIPGGFIHSLTSGWTVRHGHSAAIVGLRSFTWDFIRPLYPDEPFYFTNSTVDASEIDERLGLVNTVRRVFDENEHLYAVGRMNVVMLRRGAGSISAGAGPQPDDGSSLEGDTNANE